MHYFSIDFDNIYIKRMCYLKNIISEENIEFDI